MELSEHAQINRAAWNVAAAEYADHARRQWSAEDITWGIWDLPETGIGALGDVAGKDVIELGCGTAYFSSWLARRGARPVGIDLSERQLETASAMQAEHGLDFPLLHGTAERVPLEGASFDLAVSEYGASLWCDPDAWVAEAARLLRPGGRLVFLTNSVLVTLCAPDAGAAGDRLLRHQRGLRVVTYADEAGIEFHLAHGDWIATLRRYGFDVEALHELYAPEGAEQTRFEWVTPEWAQRWPFEELWVARLRA